MRTIIERLAINAALSHLMTAKQGWLDCGGVKEMFTALPICRTS
jgi:hypothetical protein